MVLPSSGTLRSQRISTFLPLRSASPRSDTDFFAIEITDERADERECARGTHREDGAKASTPASSARARTATFIV